MSLPFEASEDWATLNNLVDRREVKQSATKRPMNKIYGKEKAATSSSCVLQS
jgi:hypothetical protein